MKSFQDKGSDRRLSSLPVSPPTRSWSHILGEARTRILLWYSLILGLVFLAGIPAFRYLLFQRVDQRVHRDMAEEVATLRSLITSSDRFLNHLEDQNPEALEHLQEYIKTTHRNAVPPRSSADLEQFFRQYLRYSIPDDSTFLITFVNGEFFKSSPRGRPKPLQKESNLMRQWAKQIQPTQGEREFADPEVGKLLYTVEPIQINGRTRGVFVVAHATEGERAEIIEASIVIIQVSLSLFCTALVLAWFAAGRVLAPLRTITTTAQLISETDLSQRLPARGQGELAELAATFNTMMDRLEIAFGCQREFVNDAGHELRTPITIIRGHLELMGDDPEEQRETLMLVVSELERMSRLVDDMILLAKAERTDFLHLATVDATELTEELFTKARALAEREWQLDETAQGKVVVDRERITEAIMNLAQNATQHTRGEDTIAIGSTIAKGKVRFWVRDIGEGIPLPEQKRIFERFARASNSRRRSEGAGLGLSIVRAIAEAHGGQVLLRSKLGSGSMFTIVLPLDPPQETVTHDAYPHR
ncbi:MAG: HAMP domain-containing protein [Leptolyngbyaceae cyanobacterium RU_5_1]|nr:HAMP domain-containing protein [Leptolyngbyaceae cyanobacterium RU_5_1]